MVPWSCLCHTTTVVMNQEFQQYVDADFTFSCQALPRAPWREWVYAQHVASAGPQDAGTRGYQTETMLLVTRQSWAWKRRGQHHLHRHCSSVSSLIPPHSVQMSGKTDFQQDILTSLYLCSEARHDSATKLAEGLASGSVDHPARVFSASSPFLIFKCFSFNNKEGFMPAVWLFFVGPPCEFFYTWSDLWEKGECFSSCFMIL